MNTFSTISQSFFLRMMRSWINFILLAKLWLRCYFSNTFITSTECRVSWQREYQNYKANTTANFSKIWREHHEKPKSILFYILWKEFFFNFARKKLVKIPILSPKKSNLGSIKSKKRAEIEFTEVNRSHLQLKSIAN